MEGWDVKHLVRTIVTSQTYRQASTATPELLERDPDNRLLARQSRFRVDAEIVHDVALSVSGLLAETIRRSQRQAIPAGWLLRDSEFSEARVFGKPWRGPVPARRLHGVAAHLPASDSSGTSMRPPARSAP